VSLLEHSADKLRAGWRRHRALALISAFWIIVTLYLAEAGTGLILVKSIALSPVPPHSVHHHTTREYSVSYHYNNIGVRGPQFAPDTLYDVLLIGDSFMFGVGVEENQTVAGLLAANGLSVFSAAESATNPPQYLQKVKVLTAWGLRSRAMVVGLFVGNDFQGLRGKDITPLLSASFGDAAEPYTWRSFLALQRVRYVVSSSRAKWLNNALFPHAFERRMRFYDDPAEFFAQGDPEMTWRMRNPPTGDADENEFLKAAEINDETVDKAITLLEAIANASPAQDKIVALLPLALFHRRQYGGAYERYMQILRERLSKHYRVIDMHAIGNPGLYWAHDGHLNPAGNRCLAAAIEAALNKQVPVLCPEPPTPTTPK
jgi:hypothetical protein